MTDKREDVARKLADEVIRDNRIFDFAWGDNPEGLRVVLMEKFSALLSASQDRDVGVKAAAKIVRKHIDAILDEHAHRETDTNATVFHSIEAEELAVTLGEIEEEILALPSTPPSVAVIPDGWQPIETQPDFMERPGRQFIRIEGEAEHSGMCWSRVWCGEAYIRKEGADDEMLGYRKSDILRLCKDGDMIPSSARVTHWMPARFSLLTLSAAPSPASDISPSRRPPTGK